VVEGIREGMTYVVAVRDVSHDALGDGEHRV
jgi:predicted RNA-binding protein with TRAM domain